LPLVPREDQENYEQHEVAISRDLDILDELSPFHLLFNDVELPLPELLEDLVLFVFLLNEGLVNGLPPLGGSLWQRPSR
jgi:hypothetical protein